MQSFQDFLQSRRKKSADSDELQLLKRSRSSHASSPPHELHSQLQNLSSSSKTLPGSLSNSFSYKAAAAADAAAAPVAHTTTTVSGATPPSGGRYLSRSGTAASSRHKRSDGLTAALQQLISPQRSSGALSSSSSFRVGAAAAAATSAASAATSTAGNHVSPAAAAVGPALQELLASTSSRSAGLGVASTNSLPRLQPLSVADTLHSPLSRSAVVTPPGGRTPTGDRTPGGSRRYQGAEAAAGFSTSGPADSVGAAAAAVAAASSGGGGSLPAALNNHSSSWSVERSGTAVLQEAAARAAALHRSTTVKSQASQGDMQHAGLQTAVPTQQLLPQQSSQQQHHQQWVDVAQQQQQQRRQQEELQEQQQQRESAAALLQDLDRRFASIKDSLKGVFSPQDGVKQRQQQEQQQQLRGPNAAAAAGREDRAAGVHGGQVSQGSPQRAVYQNSMTEPYTLDDDSSSNSSSVGCSRSTSPTAGTGVGSKSPQQQRHQHQQQHQQQQQQLLTPSDSSNSDAGSSEDEQPSSSRQRQQQHHHHARSLAAQQQQQQQHHHHTHAQRGPVEPTLNGGIGGPSSKPQQQQRLQQHGKPAAIAAAAAAAAAATAAAADGSLPIEVDVKCGEEGELQGATAHFIVSNVPTHLLSPGSAAAGGMGGSQQQQQGRHHSQHHSRRQQQQQPMGQEQAGKPSMLLSADPSGMSDAGGLSPVGTAREYSTLEMDIQYSTDSLDYAGAPQPRSVKPKPSIPQNQQYQQQQRQQHGLRDMRGPGGAAAAVAAAGRGVLDAVGGDHWCSNALVLAKQQAQELQQQNDALVRVLERERQQHAKTRQQVCDLKLDLQEAHAEWEVKLQALRQEKAAAEVQLRRALAGGDQQETFAAYDAALLASAARVEEAQSASTKLATQVAELELQVQQLQLICSTSAVGPGGALTSAQAGPKTAQRRPLSGSSTVSTTSRADGAAVVRAVASAECRSPERRSPCRQGFAAGAAADGTGGRGVRALRQHQAHLEQQVAKLSEELTQLQRENVKLVRYKRQYEVAAQSLQASAGAKAAAEAFAEEAGLRAAAAMGRAEKLDMEVEQLLQQLQQLKAERDRLQLHLDIAQQQQRLQASLSSGGSSSRSLAAAAPGSGSGSGYHTVHYTLPGSSSQFGMATSAALAGVSGSAAVQTALGNFGLSAAGPQEPAASVPLPMPAAAAAVRQQSGGGAAQLMPASLLQSQQGVMLAHASAPTAAAGSMGGAPTAAAVFSSGGSFPMHSASQGGVALSMGEQAAMPAHTAAANGDRASFTAQVAASDADQEALYVVQQLKMALPDASPAHGQLASLMSAIQAGVQERQALAAQGKVLLDMLVGGN